MAYEDNTYTANAINQLTGLLSGAIEAQAMRPQKTSTISNMASTSTPYALENIVQNRDRIGQATKDLNEALKFRESLGYSLANALANIPQQQGYGSWLSDFARSLGAGMSGPMAAKVNRAQTQYENEMKDLAQILAYDKAMGETTTQSQNQIMKYEQMPYGTAGGKGGTQEQAEQKRNYDISPAELPEQKRGWGEREVQAVGRIDPNLGVRTPIGTALNALSNVYNPEGKEALRNNNDAYAKRFTVDRIAQIAKATGGSRGIDTMPEVNLKGGPEISAMNMNSKEFEKAVQDQAWSAADQIIKANPNAQITREELANAFINDFNHGVKKENRIVEQISSKDKPRKNVISRYTNQPIIQNTPVVGEVRNGVRFLGYYPDGSMKFEKVQ